MSFKILWLRALVMKEYFRLEVQVIFLVVVFYDHEASCMNDK